MPFYLYRLHFKGAVHFGLAGIGLEAVETKLSSDSLTSALINAFSLSEGPEGAHNLVMALSSDTPPFLMSSLFPFGPDPKEPKKYLEALVRPLSKPPLEKPELVKEVGKDLKKIVWLHPEDFLAWSGDTPIGEERLKLLLKRSAGLTSGWWKEEMRPRVALDRQSQNSSIWSQAAVWFAREVRNGDGKLTRVGAGLYGLVEFNDDSWKHRLEAAFRVLGDTGLGGERTYGLGLFRFGGFEDVGPTWEEILKGKRARRVFLSLYYPAENEREGLADALEAWEFVERRGYVVSGRNATGIKRKRVRMLVEGSVARKPLKGAMADVTPDNASDLGISHRIYRSGLAFLVPHGDE